MKLSLLNKREDALSIIENSLVDYHNRSRLDAKKCDDHTPRPSDWPFLVNDQLNIIYRKNIPTRILRAAIKEYGHSDYFLVSLVKRIYIEVCISRIFRSLLSSARLSADWGGVATDILIIPGNHSIRLLDTARGKSTVIGKIGYSNVRLRAAIEARVSGVSIPGPSILEYDPNWNWYTEELIVGMPVNRTHDADRSQRAVSSAQSALREIYLQTAQTKNLWNYVDYLCACLKVEIRGLPAVYGLQYRVGITNLAEELKAWVRARSHENTPVITVLSHGDFQEGNILLPSPTHDADVFLIDWEYATERIWLYDALVLSLKCRAPIGLGDRIIELVEGTPGCFEQLTLIYDIGVSVHVDKFAVIFVFLLEELRFRVADCSVPSAFHESPGLTQCMIEAQKLLAHLTVEVRD